MFGVMVNTGAIIAGSILGLFLKKGLHDRFKNIVFQAIGLSVLFIGASGTVKGLMNPEAEAILFIISLVAGGVLGEWANIEGKLDYLGNLLHRKFQQSGHNIAEGFVSATLIFCVGTMAIIGSLNSGIRGDNNMLFAKAVLDGVTSVILASTMGLGVIFSAVAVFLYQGMIVLFAHTIEPYLTQDIIREMSIVGSILIFGIGLNLLNIKEIKTGNLLPSILVPVFYYLVISPFFV